MPCWLRFGFPFGHRDAEAPRRRADREVSTGAPGAAGDALAAGASKREKRLETFSAGAKA